MPVKHFHTSGFSSVEVSFRTKGVNSDLILMHPYMHTYVYEWISDGKAANSSASFKEGEKKERRLISNVMIIVKSVTK